MFVVIVVKKVLTLLKPLVKVKKETLFFLIYLFHLEDVNSKLLEFDVV